MTKEQMFEQAKQKGETFTEEDYIERNVKVKQELNGNMDFIGELYISGILRDNISQSILNNLLADKMISNDTVEAALRFINKIGPVLERKYKDNEKQAAKEDGKGAKGPKFSRDDYEAIIARFKWTEENMDLPLNTRIRMLIKNMIENKESGW